MCNRNSLMQPWPLTTGWLSKLLSASELTLLRPLALAQAIPANYIQVLPLSQMLRSLT